VKAAAVNRRYSLDQSQNPANTDPAKRAAGIPANYPNTVNMLLGGGRSIGYQAGSTFKLFTMLTALEQGYGLNLLFYAPPRYTSRYYTGWNDPDACVGGHWCPHNASRGMTGTQTTWSGFGKSVNTYCVQVEQKVGAQNAVATAQRLGLTWHTDIDRLQATPAKARTWGAFTLGMADTPLEMASAYATIAADGRYCEPLRVRSISLPDGRPAVGPNGRPGRGAALQPGGQPGRRAGGGRRGALPHRVRGGRRRVWRMVDRTPGVPDRRAALRRQDGYHG
jgi:Penicillin binding protein transpeptidase domain